jgi:lipopolysaccharide transport system ATP-binding protein
VLMDQGEILEQGTAEKVSDAYLKRAHARGNERLSALNRGTSEYPRWGTGEMEIYELELTDAQGEQGHVMRTGEPFQLLLRYECHEEVQNPVFGIGIYRSDGTYVNGSNHHWRDQPIQLEQVKAGEKGEVRMEFASLPLLAGQYYITTFLYDHSKAAPTAIDHQEHAITFEVLDPRNHQHGMLYLPTRWTIQRPGQEPTTVSES